MYNDWKKILSQFYTCVIFVLKIIYFKDYKEGYLSIIHTHIYIFEYSKFLFNKIMKIINGQTKCIINNLSLFQQLNDYN